MSIFLVDYENVHSNGFNGINQLSENDLIIVFYTKEVKQIPIDLHLKLQNAKAKIEYLKAENGRKNALDFQLTSYLGYLISKNSNESYYIVSNDQGYKVLTSFWSENNILVKSKVSLVTDLSLKVEKDVQAQFKQKVQLALKDSAYSEKLNEILSIIDKYKTKQGINNALVKEFESKKAGEVYKLIKPLLTNKKGDDKH
ncbi:MAG TPA: PIN domain-containing protein [Erysipelotrichaceae bacterium]|nr:PIN domain-containing protein [Erysipelotrichaceae bacterium]